MKGLKGGYEMIIPYLKKNLKKIKNRVLNVFAYVALNIWLLPKPGKRVIFCPSCHNASCWRMQGSTWSLEHCEVCAYHKMEDVTNE